MRRPVFLTLLCVAIALLTWAFSTSGKEGVLIFILGAAILLSMLAVCGLRLVGSAHHKRKTSATNNSAILGALLGVFLGGGYWREKWFWPRHVFHLQSRFAGARFRY